MTVTKKNLMICTLILSLLALGACTREITTVQQVDPGASNCFNCHSDQDTYLIDKQMEWSYSAHGIGAYVAYAGNRSGCSECHSGSGFEAFLAGEEDVPYATPIRCFSCHAPHSNGDFGLRVTEPGVMADGTSMDLGAANLCVSCHKSRSSVYDYIVADAADSVTIANRFGPHHGPQGDLVMGTNGFEFEGYTYDTSAPTAHIAAGACLACHYAENAAVDLGGHSFKMENDAEDLNVDGCNLCHTDLDDFDVNGSRSTIDALGEELHALLLADGLLSESGSTVTGARTTYEKAGALWNFVVWEEDRSHGAHNPDYVEGLLESSIEIMGGTPTK